MLLPRRPIALKVLASIALCILYFLVHHLWSLRGLRHWPTFAQSTLRPTRIPQKIWYKLGPSGLTNQTREWTSTCIDANPHYKVSFMTDDEGDTYVRRTFASRPDIVDSYLGLTIPILKADLLRYLLLYAEGGIWSDLDVSCEGTPIDEWIPVQFKSKTGLVVGWEFDVGWGDNFIRQFNSWTIMAQPGLPHVAMVIDDILQGLRDKMAEHNVTLAELRLSMVGDVVHLTGPIRFTMSVLKSLESTINGTVDIVHFSNLREPKLVGDVLVMPGYAFAASSNKYESNEVLGPPLVTHHYAGTWKNEQGGELA
ncbi:uncharacterized protein BCR38DRAFT_445730 [Pseudomassariella vexata]|uniref:Initiation-specific alpha-1,6-mannosyltransferase n=1 Tax=Pseudomassariella vexata TaxID=1141098 RepID=A0A1Y2DIU4_9PEZI|nr:uncharacterized protein BCR38DRAFT_445730 [Pseudomassariella vexata]ORY59153.1 hypothetical protein BCR38DRAFT_445730 [Pseudomassariella vexata]